MDNVFISANSLVRAVRAEMYVAGVDVRVFRDHVRCEGGGLYGAVGAVFALVRALLRVLLLVAPHRVVVAGAVAAFVAAVRLVAWNNNEKP